MSMSLFISLSFFIFPWIHISFGFIIVPKSYRQSSIPFHPLHNNNNNIASSSSNDPQITWPLGEQQQQQDEEQQQRGDFHIPNTGVSISDEMDEAIKDRFVTEVVPIKGLKGVAQLVTTAVRSGSFEPVRYLVPISLASSSSSSSWNETTTTTTTTSTVEQPPVVNTENGNQDEKGVQGVRYAMIDIPPYSPQLMDQMIRFMGNGSELVVAMITNRDSIHYDNAPSLYSARRSDLKRWKEAFPTLEVAAYRLDIPRECRPYVTQILDGYGPFGWKDLDKKEEEHGWNSTTRTTTTTNTTSSFVELGRPLTIETWDDDVAETILSGNGNVDMEDKKTSFLVEEDSEYSPETIRTKEATMNIIAVYTPGHSFGSLSYLFPSQELCFSGYTIPIEDSRMDENQGIGGTGPALDCRGYISTNKGGILRQMESAKSLVQTYVDRFRVVLPSRGDPLFLDDNAKEREKDLLEILDQYKKIGEIYEQLGIMDNDKDDNDGDGKEM